MFLETSLVLIILALTIFIANYILSLKSKKNIRNYNEALKYLKLSAVTRESLITKLKELLVAMRPKIKNTSGLIKKQLEALLEEILISVEIVAEHNGWMFSDIKEEAEKEAEKNIPKPNIRRPISSKLLNRKAIKENPLGFEIIFDDTGKYRKKENKILAIKNC